RKPARWWWATRRASSARRSRPSTRCTRAWWPSRNSSWTDEPPRSALRVVAALREGAGLPWGGPAGALMSGPVADGEHPSLSAFIDSLWLEEGLARNTLEAYRRDLALFGQWLAGHGKALPDAQEADIHGYFAERHAATRATTANRRLTVFKRYFRWALRERFVSADPTLRLLPARQPLRVPKTLTEVQVEALLAAP